MTAPHVGETFHVDLDGVLIAGADAGAVGENWLWPQGDESARRPFPDKVTIRLAAGDAVQILTPWGGGWGRSPR